LNPDHAFKYQNCLKLKDADISEKFGFAQKTPMPLLVAPQA